MPYFETDPEPTNSSILIRCIVYVCINSAQPLLIDAMKYNGAASVSTFIYIIPTYLAMVIIGLGPRKKSIWDESKRFGYITILALCDLSHQLLEKAGLVFSGSAVYMMASSSSSVWIALLSRLILKKKISLMQWMGISFICAGLSLKGFHVTRESSANEFLGIILTISATMLHAFTIVYNEKFLTAKEPIEGLNLVFLTGIVSTTMMAIWSLVWTLPRWNSLVTDHISSKGGSAQTAIICFFLLLLCGILRSATLWYIIKHMGAISSGVLKGIRTPSVFFLSHFLFCHLDSTQCLSKIKTLAAILCASGVTLYSLDLKKPKTIDQEETPLIGTVDSNTCAPKQ